MIVRVAQENLRDGMAAVRALWTARSLKELYGAQVQAVERIARRNVDASVAVGRAAGQALGNAVRRSVSLRRPTKN